MIPLSCLIELYQAAIYCAYCECTLPAQYEPVLVLCSCGCRDYAYGGICTACIEAAVQAHESDDCHIGACTMHEGGIV